MPVSGNWLIAQRFLVTGVFKLVRLIFNTVQRVYWELNGTARKLRKARLPQNYERSAQVLDVVFVHRFCLMMMADINQFICTHSHFENPQYIIDNDDVTLLTVNDHNAIFCEPTEKGMHLWHLKYSAFIHIAQMNFCRRLIVVPLSTFHRLAEKIGDPSGELTFLFHVPRSGSTLVVQMMEETGRCVAISEPTSPFYLAMKYRKFGDSPEIRRLLRDVIRWECRPYPSIQPPPLGYFVKLTSFAIFGVPLFRELFPTSRFLFMYRDIENVAKSVYRSTMVVPSARMIFEAGRFSSHAVKFLLNSLRIEAADYCIEGLRVENDFMPGLLMVAVMTATYREMRRDGIDVRAVHYEDLVARPVDMCRVILEFSGLPVSLSELAIKAFDVDSQRNSPIARSIIGRFKDPQMTPQIKERLNELLKKFEVPLIGEPGIIEGTLAC